MNLDREYLEFYLEKEMHKRRNEAVKKLSSLMHPGHEKVAELFSYSLAFAYNEDLPEAKKIADILLLEQEGFAAIEDNFDLFNKIIREKMADAEAEAQYDHYVSSDYDDRIPACY